MMSIVRTALAVVLSVLMSAAFAGDDVKLPPGAKMPAQPREWIAPTVDMTPPPAPARFGEKWTRDRQLPAALAGHSAVAVGSRIFVLGGVSGKEHLGMRDVYTCTASKSGLGSWSKTTPLPVPAAFSAVVVAGKRLYLIGGASREGMHHLYKSVWSAEVKGGSLGKWREEAGLPEAIMYQAAAFLDGYIYVLGGFNGQEYGRKTLYSKVNTDGTLGEWKTATAVYPHPIGRTTMLPAGSCLVVCGGVNWDSQGEHISSLMMRGKRTAEGDITEWVSDDGIKMSSRSMTYSISEHAGTTDGNFLYAAGGRDPGTLGVATVQAAWISPDGRITRWQYGPDMPAWGMKGPVQPVRLYQSAAVIADNRLFVLGGFLSIREVSKLTWSINLKPYQEPEWVKGWRERQGKK
jgi:hypothetical protein